MKYTFVLLPIFLLCSCLSKKKKQYVTVDLNFTCAPIEYFDTLQTVLFTNDKSDLGAEPKGLEQLFTSDDRFYKKYMVKTKGHFYVDSVERKEYWTFLAEGRLHNAPYTAFDHTINFSDSALDTIKLNVCMEPNIKYMR